VEVSGPEEHEEDEFQKYLARKAQADRERKAAVDEV
jgi:hypothetical protein